MIDLLKKILGLRHYLRLILQRLAAIPVHRRNMKRMKEVYKRDFDGKLVGTLHNEVIGTFAMFTEYYLRYCRVYNYDPKKDVVLIGSPKVVNHQLQKMFEREVNIIKDENLYDTIYNGGHFYLKKINRYIKDSVPKDIKNGIIYYPDCPMNIDFTDGEVDYGKSLLKKLGLADVEKFIPVHNKGQSYWLMEKGISKPWDVYRDTNFEDLIPGINFLKNEGYQVIRAGHYENPKNANYISLMNLKQDEKAFLDIFIQRNCEFSICGSSGINLLPWLFKIPALFHNLIPMDECPIIERGIIIPKLLRDKRTRKLLTISEIRGLKSRLTYFSRGQIKSYIKSADGFQSINLYVKHRMEIVDNTPEEVVQGIKEIILYVKGELVLNEDQQELQDRFKSLFPLYHPMRHMRGIVSPSFLVKYKEILN